MTRILIVDDHPIFRQGLAIALGDADDLTVCGQGASADEAIELARQLLPDVALIDLSMPGGGLSAVRTIRQEQPQIRQAILTASEDSDDVMAALRAGALGYIVKGIGGQALIDAVKEVAAGHGYIAPMLAARILSEMSLEGSAASTETTASDGQPLAHLTPREGQVLEMVAAGLSNKEIALRGDMQEKTVKHHMTRILQKLHVRNRTEAAMVLRKSRDGG